MMARAAWGKAKLEVLALQHEIISHLQEGKNLQEIFEAFNAAGKLTAKKTQFYRHASAIRKALPSSCPSPLSSVVASPSNSPVPSAALTKPLMVSSDHSINRKPKPDRFVHDGVSDPEKLKDFF